jgi:hypothetical protein
LCKEYSENELPTVTRNGEFYLLGYNAKKSSVCYLLHDGFLLSLFFDPEDGYKLFLRNVGSISTDYKALYSR